MGLNLTVAVLVLAMTFMHSIWGLFSGLMHVFCAIIAMAVAFGFSEAIGASLVKQLGTSPGYTEATVMILLFFGVMLGLRLAADMLVRGNVKIPPTVDWIGGAVCGFIGAEITVGVLLVSIFLLPLGGNVLGFQRYTRNESQTNADHTFMPEFQRAGVWFMPDAFVSGLFSILSDGSLASGTRFSEVYPDYPEWLYFTGNTVQANSTPAPYRDKRADGYRKGISVTKWWEESQLVDDAVYRRDVPDEKKRQPPLSPQEFTATAGNKLIGVRVDLRDDSADRDRGNSVHLFRPTMIRIVGDEDGRPAQYPARAVRAAFSDGGRIKWRVTDYDNNVQLANGAQTVDVAFETPTEFQPRFVEYRRRARAAIPRGDETAMLDREPGSVVVAAVDDGQQPVTFDESFQGNSASIQGYALPFELATKNAKSLTVTGEFVIEGRLTGQKERFAPQRGDDVVRSFQAPEGKTLVQIRFEYDKVKTIVGQVFNFVEQIAQFQVQDGNGDRHLMVGCWAQLTRGGKPYLEMVYDPDPASGTCDYKQGFVNLPGLTRQEIQAPGTELCLLFVVPKDCREITALLQGTNTVPLNIKIDPR